MFKVGQWVWFNYNKWFGKIHGKLPKIHGEQVYLVEFAETLKHQKISEQDLHETADDMFEEQDWHKEISDDFNIVYWTEKNDLYNDVVFNLELKDYIVHGRASVSLHLAIHQKLIELGWVHD